MLENFHLFFHNFINRNTLYDNMKIPSLKKYKKMKRLFSNTRFLISFIIIISITILSITIAYKSYFIDPTDDINFYDFSLNIISELVGILITVLLIDYLNEEKREKEFLEEKAWDLLHKMDYAIWVWQGGSKRFDAIELNQLLLNININSPISNFTRNLILRLGGQSTNILNTQSKLLSKNKYMSLRFALNELSKLNNCTDIHLPLTPHNQDQKRDVSIHLTIGLSHLNDFLNLGISNPFYNTPIITNDSIQSQTIRYQG